MTANLHLLKRVQDARLKWQRAHQRVMEINEQEAPTPDGYYAHRHALHVESVAVKAYHRALQDFQAAVAPQPVNGAGLTPRDQEVLTLIASAKSSKQVAVQLGISFKTAACHRYNLQRKLNAGNTADLTRAALRMGLIEL